MLVLLFLVGLIQFFTYWLCEPFISFLTNVLVIRLFPGIALLIVIYIFSLKDNNYA
jgi:hypothetical protein